jgi:hypothetical protein
VATPTLQQARSHYLRQRNIAAMAVAAVRRLFARNRPLVEVASTVATYQYASATASSQSIAAMAGEQAALTNAAAFAGVSSRGFPIVEPIIATIDKVTEAPVEALPANWWTDAQEFMAQIEQLIWTEVQDAGRSASQTEFVARPDWQNYVRMLTPPSCARCAILAGRIYKDLDAFDRHPLCDCVMIPVQNWQEAHDNGLISSFEDLFNKGLLKTKVSADSDQYRDALSKADMQAIRDGADPIEVVNATRGTSQPGITNAKTVDIFGHRVKATTYGTTKRAAWRRANPTRLVRLRPEAIYEAATSREDAIRLLTLYGYISPPKYVKKAAT